MLIKQLHEEHPLRSQTSPSIEDNSVQPTPSQPSAAADRRLQKAFFAQRQALSRSSSGSSSIDRTPHQRDGPHRDDVLTRASSLPVCFSRGKLCRKEEPKCERGEGLNTAHKRKSAQTSDASSSTTTSLPTPVTESYTSNSAPPSSSKRRRLLASGSWSQMRSVGPSQARAGSAPSYTPVQAPAYVLSPRIPSLSLRESVPPKIDETASDTGQSEPSAPSRTPPPPQSSLILPLPAAPRTPTAPRTQTSLSPPPPAPAAPPADPSQPGPPSTSNITTTSAAQSRHNPRILAFAMNHRPGQFAKRKLLAKAETKKGTG
ncbi:unnamed protein product [Tilletia controversa]|uniref:Uncharacterized protein n=3 Tax=Tilletia TaxID=13289 RepID=A0A8X7MWL9_9BASI|nr:hypothetical protein CF336_g3616 [Tilletia laevis]KAE8199288.1 hypothetical protein CF328_g3295 [Tilletia controversa]KAE8261783.1 hypothetical protein A4X03_0g2967 [Tilletia caries]KAE8204050.1 hypothetical protein CF335_g2790 [Tilletia laevis]KAE8252277.1 hypothetical protein A4X06_0g2302 [Tilletia controversa]